MMQMNTVVVFASQVMRSLGPEIVRVIFFNFSCSSDSVFVLERGMIRNAISDANLYSHIAQLRFSHKLCVFSRQDKMSFKFIFNTL